MIIDDIKQAGAQLGACPLLARAETMDSLLSLLFTPQGREFCSTHNFPSLEIIRGLDATTAKHNDIYVDSGLVHITARGNMAIVGNTIATIEVDGVHCQELVKIIVMHGAKANIKARNYAVVIASTIGDQTSIEHQQDNEAQIYFD